MRLRSVLRSRWVRIPLVVTVLVVLCGAGALAYLLITTTPAMYGSSDAPMADDEGGESTDEAQALVYTSLRPSNWDIYLFDGREAAPRRLTDHPNLDYNAVLSADGRWVVFVSECDGNANLYALDLTTDAGPIPLTTHPGMDDAPTLSPDGGRVAFVSTRSGNPDVFVMPFAPGDPDVEAEAVNVTDDPYGDFNPAFSPDGARLAFSSNRAIFRRWNPLRLIPTAVAVTDIYVADVDGSNVTRVASGFAVSGSPAWTEKKDALLFYRFAGATDSGVYRTRLADNDTVRLTPEDLPALTPTAGPNGSAIFVGLDESESPEGEPALERHGGRLYRVALDGAGLTALTDDGRRYLAPFYDWRTGQLVAHGDGPVPDDVRMSNGTPFTWAGAARTPQMPDRRLRLQPLRSYFPSVADHSDRLVAVQWVHQDKGHPPGASPIVSARFDGTGIASIFPGDDDGFIWVPVTTRDGAWVFFSKGARFGAVDDDVDIWKVRSDGTSAVNLTPDSMANDAFPDVSADGRRVVFRSGRAAEAGSGPDGNKEST